MSESNAELLINDIDSSYNLLFHKLSAINCIAENQIPNESKNCALKIIKTLEKVNSWFDEQKLFSEIDADETEAQAFKLLDDDLNRKSNLILDLEERISTYKDKVNELLSSL